MEAIAYKNGKKSTTKVETTGAPYQVVLTPDRTTLTADGKDATVITVSVRDKEGRQVPGANTLIRFAINGGPSSHEQDKYNDAAAQRSLFNGNCQVILQSAKTGGVVFSATAEGLRPASASIKTTVATSSY